MSGIIRFSRSLSRPILQQTNRKCNRVNIIARNRSSFSYRDITPPAQEPNTKIAAAVGFLFTLWIGLNWYNDPSHVTGHFPDIVPSEWTDEELGIPPDEEDIYPPGYVPLKDR